MPALDQVERRSDTEALAARAADGDMEALAALYDRYADDVRRVAVLAVGGNVDVARDVSGEVWMAVGKGIHTYQWRQGHGFAAWLVTVTRNKAKDHYRRASVRREVVTADMLVLDVVDTAESAEDAVVRREQARQVEIALRQLTVPQRQCLQLTFWCKLSLSEVADIMGSNPNAIGVLRNRALKAMRRALPPDVSDVGTTTRPGPARRMISAHGAAAGEAGTRC